MHPRHRTAPPSRHGRIATRGSLCAALSAAAVLTIAGSGAALTSAGHGATQRTAGVLPRVRQVSERMPVVGPSRALAATRPPLPGRDLHPAQTGRSVDTWSTLATLPGAVVHDVDFVTPRVGYAAAELGQVWKTTDGGATWTKVLNRGFPYYYYGIDAISRRTVVASGFDDQTSEGILTWSHDGGATWGADQVVSPNAWVDRVRIPDSGKGGLAMNGLGASGSDPNDAWFRSRQQWHQVVVDPNGGWFGSEFSLDGAGPGQAAASGITYCQSADTGRQWACRGSIDSVFDGATEFNGSAGWVGGGEISPDVAGWLHRTRDGGQTWSGRVLTTAWPIRQIESLGPRLVWAAGGNIYSGAGGIDVSTDGGRTWTQDLDTGTEVGACSHHAIGTGAKTRVWCVGDAYDGSQFSSVVYATTVATPAS